MSTLCAVAMELVTTLPTPQAGACNALRFFVVVRFSRHESLQVLNLARVMRAESLVAPKESSEVSLQQRVMAGRSPGFYLAIRISCILFLIKLIFIESI